MKKIGYFDNEKREYIIENMYPLRPLKNYLWNEGLIIDLDQFGNGLSKACINKEFRPLINDYRLVYVRDNDNGEIYDINRNFAKKNFSLFRSRVGLGYHTVESAYNGLSASLTILVPETGFVELHRIALKNEKDTRKNLSVYTYISPNVNISQNQAYTRARYDEQYMGLYYAHSAHKLQQEYRDVFYYSDTAADAWALSKDDFVGVYGDFALPDGLTKDSLPCNFATFEPYYIGALQFNIVLEPQEEREFYFAVGTVRQEEEAKALAEKYIGKTTFQRELEKQKEKSEEHIRTAFIQTEDEYLDTMANIWLKRQMSLGKTWGRVYGKGFRDVLQDITGFVSLDKPLARERILYTLKHQFINGNAIRMFDPILDYPYQDMPAWIAPTVLAYLKESGDFSILKEEVGYYDDDRNESVFMHVKRGIDYLFATQGEHGLSLWGGGDWNDSIDSAGLQMKGESIWLSIATMNCSRDYIEILENAPIDNAAELIVDTKAKREKLKGSIFKYGFENGRFIYGINDWGEKVGAEECKEGKFFLNPQTWATMSDFLTIEEKQRVMDLVEARLKCDYGYMLQDRPYLTPNDHLGRLTYFEQGVYENGSVYNHGVMFKIVADCCIGRGDNAWNTLKMNRYDNPQNPNSGVEPYALSNMYFGPSAIHKKGFAPQSWITGSAGWMYRAIIEFLLGVKPDFNGLKLVPCLPTSWKGAKVERIFRDVKYSIEFIPAEENRLIVDGKEVTGNIVPLFEEGSEHTVAYYYKVKNT